MSDLRRFVRRLVESVATHDPDALRNPLPVGEIIHRMMPYRACRGPLGLDTAEDYELLMLRMLAEEEGLVTVFPPETAERCRVEVAAVLPDLAFLQELLDATIRIHTDVLARSPSPAPAAPVQPPHASPAPTEPEAPGEAGEAPGSEGAPSEPPEDEPPPVAEAPLAPLAPEVVAALDQEEAEALVADLELDLNARGLDPTPGAGADLDRTPSRDGDGTTPELRPTGGEAPGEPAPPTVALPVTEGRPVLLTCPHCDATLPRGRAIRFCPDCGQNVRTRRCSSCRAELEPSWRHCVMCGHPVGDSSRFA